MPYRSKGWLVEHDAVTLFNLGEMYDHGDGVPQDYERASYYYALAAGRGHAEAQCELGFLCSQGDGVDQDYE